jgi:septation ring formation regulator EzrA
MGRSDTVRDLEHIKDFLEAVERQPKLTNDADQDLRKIAADARHFAHELKQAIAEVHRHWK